MENDPVFINKVKRLVELRDNRKAIMDVLKEGKELLMRYNEAAKTCVETVKQFNEDDGVDQVSCCIRKKVRKQCEKATKHVHQYGKDSKDAQKKMSELQRLLNEKLRKLNRDLGRQNMILDESTFEVKLEGLLGQLVEPLKQLNDTLSPMDPDGTHREQSQLWYEFQQFRTLLNEYNKVNQEMTEQQNEFTRSPHAVRSVTFCCTM